MARSAPMVSRWNSCIFVLAITLLSSSCFAPSYGDGGLRCADGPTPCPDGYYCAVTATCWRNGHAPPRPPAPLTTASAGAVRVGGAAGGSHNLDISIGQPLVGSAAADGDHTIQFGIMRNAVSK